MKFLFISHFVSDEYEKLKTELKEQKDQYEEHISELEKKLNSEKKVQEMLKLRLKEEVTSRYFTVKGFHCQTSIC